MTTVLAIGVDRRIVLFVDGVDVLEGTLTVSGDGLLGDHVCVLKQAETSAGGTALPRWIGLTHHPDAGRAADPDEAVLIRLTAPPAFREELARRVRPGMPTIASDLHGHPDRCSGTDLYGMTSEVVDAAPPAERSRRQG